MNVKQLGVGQRENRVGQVSRKPKKLSWLDAREDERAILPWVGKRIHERVSDEWKSMLREHARKFGQPIGPHARNIRAASIFIACGDLNEEDKEKYLTDSEWRFGFECTHLIKLFMVVPDEWYEAMKNHPKWASRVVWDTVDRLRSELDAAVAENLGKSA